MTGGYTMKEKNIRELAKRMGLITVEDMCQYTIAQLVVKVANKVNELVGEVWRFETDVQEIVKTQNEKIQYLLGEGLHLEVENIFNRWIQDGTFDILINQTALKKVNDRIDTIEVDVKNFGAKGDGVTYDSDSIQEFLTFCSVNQVKGRVTKGEYILDKQLHITSNTHLVFDEGAMFKQIHPNTMVNIQNDNHTGYNGYKNIKIENGVFNCNGDVVSDTMNCFFIQHAQNVEFNSCVFKNVRSYHALDINGCKNVRVINCKFLNSYDSTNKDDREAIQIDLSAPVNGEYSVCWDYTPTVDVLVEGCYFGRDDLNTLPFTTAVGSHNVRHGVFFKNIVVRDCVMDGCSKFAINGWKWVNCRVENNNIYDCGGGVKLDSPHRKSVSASDKNGVYKGLEKSYGNIIYNNRIVNTVKEGIFIRGKYITSPEEGESGNGCIHDCVISYNTITSNNGHSLITLLNTYNITVEGNRIEGGNRDGIRVYSSFNNVIKNNRISQSGNYGISISNTTLDSTDGTGVCVNNIIDGNTIEESNYCGVFLTGGASGVCVNNTFTKCNSSDDATKSIIDVSAKSSDFIISNNRFIDSNVFKNLIYVTNMCQRVNVTNNVSNVVGSSKYFNDSINGLMDYNI